VMNLCWKFLLPWSLVNVAAAGAAYEYVKSEMREASHA